MMIEPISSPSIFALSQLGIGSKTRNKPNFAHGIAYRENFGERTLARHSQMVLPSGRFDQEPLPSNPLLSEADHDSCGRNSDNSIIPKAKLQ